MDPFAGPGGLSVRFTQADTRRAKFVMQDCSMGLANGLRRVMLSEVPTLAIDVVEVFENSTSIPDEMLAHRIGLVPLSSRGIDDMAYTHECDCEEMCEICTVVLMLDARSQEDASMPVYATDLVLEGGTANEHLGHPVATDPDKKGPLIAKLGKGQAVRMRCLARKGIAKDHVKWDPTGAIGFEYDPNNNLDHLDYWYEENVSKEWPVDEQNATMDSLPREEEAPDFDNEPSRFFWNVEAAGGLDPDLIVLGSIKSMQQKLAGVLQSLTGVEDARTGFGDGSPIGGPVDDFGAAVDGQNGGLGTAYAGNASAWGNATPYGTTAYGGATGAGQGW